MREGAPTLMPQITTDVRDCARCGDDHDGVIFAELLRPIELMQRQGGGYVFKITHWASCPKTAEPILMRSSGEEDAG